MEAVANYNEVLPGVVLKQFSQDLYKVVQKIESTVRSILSRNKALQAIRAFSMKLNAFLGTETKEEQVVEVQAPQIEEPVVVEAVSEVVPTEQPAPVVAETVTEEVRATAVTPPSNYRVEGSKSVSAKSYIAEGIFRSKEVIDKPLKSEQSEVVDKVVQASSELQQIPASEPLPEIPNIEPVITQELSPVEENTEDKPIEPVHMEPLPEINLGVPTMESSVTDNEPVMDQNPTVHTEETNLQPMEIPSDVEERLVRLETPTVNVENNEEVEQTHENGSAKEALENLKRIVEENKDLKTNNTNLLDRNRELEEQVVSINNNLDQTKEELSVAKGEVIEFGEAAKRFKTENDSLKESLAQKEAQLTEMTNAINSVLGGYQKSA